MNFIFGPIYTLFGTILSWFYSITGTYALALLLYALAFKIIFLPFSIKQQKNQIAMAKLRPKMMKIEKKYAGRNDQATLRKKQEEMLELQRQEGYSPFSGCLPLLIQLPIIIILYNVIRTPLTYICKLGEDTIANIASLLGGNAENEIALVDLIKNEVATLGPEAASAKLGFDVGTLPNFDLFGANLAATPALTVFNVLLFIPFLAAAAQWLSMWLMRRFNGTQPMAGGTDEQAQMSLRMMDIMMPAMTLFFCFSFSGMLGIYWIYQSLLSILQQFILSKTMPLPKYTAEEMKEMEKAEKARAKAQKEIMKSQPKYKSLHYIDEEDYEELPELKKPETETKSNSGLNVGSLKDDNKK